MSSEDLNSEDCKKKSEQKCHGHQLYAKETELLSDATFVFAKGSRSQMHLSDRPSVI